MFFAHYSDSAHNSDALVLLGPRTLNVNLASYPTACRADSLLMPSGQQVQGSSSYRPPPAPFSICGRATFYDLNGNTLSYVPDGPPDTLATPQLGSNDIRYFLDDQENNLIT